EAIDYAHGQGVVHRDLKPANILLSPRFPSPPGTENYSPENFTLEQWEAKITDFGLAKFASAPTGTPTEANEPTLTHTGTILGTVNYMSPEQASGKFKEIGPASDIYALGAILYELLTGRPPFQGESDLDTLQQVQWVEPTPPSRLRPGTPRDL